MLQQYEKIQEIESYLEKQDRLIKQLIRLNLWSARRLPKVYKDGVYSDLEKLTNQTYERL